MPIKIKSNLPAREILENENIFVMDETGLCTRISDR
jgi:homoserine O-succinyltransferase